MNRLILLVSCCYLLLSCHEDLPEKKDYPEEIKLVLNTTRATDTDFEIGDEIGVFVSQRNNNDNISIPGENNYVHNAKWIWNGSYFDPATPEDRIFTSPIQKLDFYAYYPFKPGIQNPRSIQHIISSDQNENFTDNDLLFGCNTEGFTSGDIPITFTHQLARVQLKVTGKSLPILNKVTLAGNPALSLDLATGSTSLISHRDIVIRMKEDELTDQYHSYLVLLPAQDLSEEILTLHIDGKENRYNIKPVHLSSGKEHVLEIEVNSPVGDYYFADGSWSFNLQQGKVPVGVISAVDNTYGYVSALKDIGSYIWANTYYDISDCSHSPLESNGVNNTTAITEHGTLNNYETPAATGCLNYAPEGLAGWYLPSIVEISNNYSNREIIDPRIQAIDGDPLSQDIYWSSTQGYENGIYTANSAYGYSTSGTILTAIEKAESHKVRPMFRFIYEQ